MNLYLITIRYGYDYWKTFKFFVVENNVQKASDLANETFKSYDYGSFYLEGIETIASEGQYGKPDILLIKGDF